MFVSPRLVWDPLLPSSKAPWSVCLTVPPPRPWLTTPAPCWEVASGRGVLKAPGDPEAGAIPQPCPQGSRTFLSFPGEELVWGEGGPEWPACSTSSESSAKTSQEEMRTGPGTWGAELWPPAMGSGNAAAPGENPA